MGFEWHAGKADSNLRKHGVDFADAATALEDELALTMRDVSSPSEERWITIGADALGRVFVVIWTMRGDKVRLISARRATSREARQYGEER